MDSLTSYLAAPVTGCAATFVDAAPARVFDLISDVLMWPAWNRSIDHTAAEGDLAPGVGFEWLSGEMHYAARVRLFERPGRIMWSTRTLGHREVTSWEIAANGSGSEVLLEESRAGVMPTFMPGRTRRALQSDTSSRLEALKVAAERRMPRVA